MRGEFNAEIGLLFVLLAGMTYLFMTEKLPVEVTAFGGLIVMVVATIVPPNQAFEGFASPAVITMLSIFILSGALERTGVADALGSRIHSVVGSREVPVMLAIMAIAGGLSAFMNNIAATAVLLPATAQIARRSGLSTSRLLIPLAFGAILGGTTTLVGTPPNLLAAEVLKERGLKPFALFDFTFLGLTLLGAGLVFMITVGRHLLPDRVAKTTSREQADLAHVYQLRDRIFSLRVPVGSPLTGLTLRQARLGATLRVQIVAIVRGREKQLAPGPEEVLRANDILVVEGQLEDLRRLLRLQGMKVTEVGFSPLEQVSSRVGCVRVRLSSGVSLVGSSLAELRFRERFGVVVAGLWRRGEHREARGNERLEEQDELLAIGDPAQIEEFASNSDFQLLEEGLPALESLEESLFFLHVPEGSPLAGTSVGDNQMRDLFGLNVVAVNREGTLLPISPPEALQEGDDLLISGEPARTLRLLDLGHVEIDSQPSETALESEDVGVVEAVLSPRSKLAGRSLAELSFRDRYGLQALAIWREGTPMSGSFVTTQLRFGDALLLQGPRNRIKLLGADPDFLVLSTMAAAPRRKGKAPVAVSALFLMIALVVGGIYPIQIAAFTAAVVTLLFRALTTEEAYQIIEWRVIFLVAALLPAGTAMQETGAALFIARTITEAIGDLGPYWVLATLLVVASGLSQALDGAPTVVLLAPVVLDIAAELQLSPYPLMMGVSLAASAAFMTPFSHKANLLVMSAGGYRVTDYLRVGTLLTIVVLGLLTLLIPVAFPFEPG